MAVVRIQFVQLEVFRHFWRRHIYHEHDYFRWDYQVRNWLNYRLI